MSAFLKQGVPRVVADADPREKPLQISVSFPVTVEARLPEPHKPLGGAEALFLLGGDPKP